MKTEKQKLHKLKTQGGEKIGTPLICKVNVYCIED
jgi:hypothetical protein